MYHHPDLGTIGSRRVSASPIGNEPDNGYKTQTAGFDPRFARFAVFLRIRIGGFLGQFPVEFGEGKNELGSAGRQSTHSNRTSGQVGNVWAVSPAAMGGGATGAGGFIDTPGLILRAGGPRR